MTDQEQSPLTQETPSPAPAQPTAPQSKPPALVVYLMDLRGMASMLFAVFGALLLIEAATGTTAAALAKAGGLHLNLWTGIALLIVSGLFALWARRGLAQES